MLWSLRDGWKKQACLLHMGAHLEIFELDTVVPQFSSVPEAVCFGTQTLKTWK